MKSGYRRYCIQPPLLCLMPAACAAGCSGKYFKHVQPKNKSTEIPFIPAFSWEAKQAFGEPILRLSGFDAYPKQRIVLRG